MTKMRKKINKEILQQFMSKFAQMVTSYGSVYFCGGTTALLLEIRDQTIDIDLKLDPEPQRSFEAIAEIKNSLDVNIELASPDNFIPATQDWKHNSKLITTIGKVSFYHYDLVLQALAKIERGHSQDLLDVKAMLSANFFSIEELKTRFDKIKPKLIRYPAVDADLFEKKLNDFLDGINDK